MEAELGHVDDNGWTFKSMRGPPPSLERQFELLHPLRERGIQRPECSGIQDSCCFQPVSPLKPPDSFGEAVIIDRRFWRCAPGIQVTYKLQPLEQAPRADVSISRCNFTLRKAMPPGRRCEPVRGTYPAQRVFACKPGTVAQVPAASRQCRRGSQAAQEESQKGLFFHLRRPTRSERASDSLDPCSGPKYISSRRRSTPRRSRSGPAR